MVKFADVEGVEDELLSVWSARRRDRLDQPGCHGARACEQRTVVDHVDDVAELFEMTLHGYSGESGTHHYCPAGHQSINPRWMKSA